jgi:hypothetical protein
VDSSWPTKPDCVTYPQPGKVFALDKSVGGRHTVLFDSGDGNLTLGYKRDLPAGTFSTIGSGIGVVGASGKVVDALPGNPLYAIMIDGSYVMSLRRTYDEGRNYSTVLMTLDTSVQAADVDGLAGTNYVIYAKASGNLMCKVFDFSGTVIDAFTTNISDCDYTKGFKIRVFTDTYGVRKVGIAYMDSSSNLLYKTSDKRGQNFS